jgi:signal transduction histidine kinase
MKIARKICRILTRFYRQKWNFICSTRLQAPDYQNLTSGRLPLIYRHYIDFSQSFRNIIDNALEAMEERTVADSGDMSDRRFTVRIGVRIGIPPEHLPWIFEPFFTTKRATGGVRAGLGLFMVRRLLAPYKAEIRVDSIPGETWVTVSIPLA